MKKILMMFGMAAGLMWGHEASAQPINYGINSTSTPQSVRAKNKDEYAEEAQARWARLKKSFGARTREKDPFGSDMDPGIPQPLPAMVEKLLESKPEKPVKKVSFREAVKKFKWNLISEKSQEVMVGSRTLKVGDRVQIEHEGVLFKLRITKITANEVEFNNTETGEKAIARERVFDPNSLDENAGDILDRITKDEAPLIIR